MATTTMTAQRWVSATRKARGSSKTRRVQPRVFGPRSQFRGVRVGVPGDPRK